MMRFLVGAWLAAPVSAYAVPVQWSMSSRVTDATGAPVVGTHDLGVSLYGAATGGPALWSNVFSAVVLEQGYVTLTLGGDVANPLDQALLANPALWMGVTVDGALGGAELSPRTRLLSAPYARRAEVAERVNVGSVSGGCSVVGALQYDTVAANLFVCDGTSWNGVGGITIVDQGGARHWSDGGVAASCETYIRPTDGAHRYQGTTGDGLYDIDPDGAGGTPATVAWCDMSTDAGGWTLVASVATWSSFWDISATAAADGARARSLGTPALSADYVMHLETWRDLLAARGGNSELRLQVKRPDTGVVVDLGFLDGLQMNATGHFTNPTAAYYGDHSPFSGAPTAACVIQYSSNFQGEVVQANFDSADPNCIGWMGWNGACGYPSMGHNGAYYQTAQSSGTPMFSHACSLSLEYYCSANHVDGPSDGVTGCNYGGKWYWIR